MKCRARQPVLFVIACGALSVAGSTLPSAPPQPARPPAGEHGARPERGDAVLQWLGAARAALEEPLAVTLPFAAKDGLVTGGTAFAFDASAGQVLELALRSDAVPPEQAIYVDVFRVVEVLGQRLHERLAALRPSASSLRTKLPSDGTYHVLVQGEASGARFALQLELAAALPFPVVGAEPDAIRSLFGASRDAGRRYHQGVDIFVQRLTPVLAVAAGRAMPGQDPLGGNTVWLNTPGVSYYYAHLDRVAVTEQQRVKPGDVLGYVGNTGNAGGVPSHLHFGVYRWGREPVDPLPLLVGRRFEGSPPAATAVDAGG
jgi:murein DD-endopeptidase MepM/ murein hydrolase activator NlpD